jgi:CDP-diglyceride synthetase
LKERLSLLTLYFFLLDLITQPLPVRTLSLLFAHFLTAFLEEGFSLSDKGRKLFYLFFVALGYVAGFFFLGGSPQSGVWIFALAVGGIILGDAEE